MLCIHYLVQFQKDKVDIWALIDFDSNVNLMTPAYTTKLGLKIQSTNVKAQKIDSSLLKTFAMVITNF